MRLSWTVRLILERPGYRLSTVSQMILEQLIGVLSGGEASPMLRSAGAETGR